jgi:hypothetical protein
MLCSERSLLKYKLDTNTKETILIINNTKHVFWL